MGNMKPDGTANEIRKLIVQLESRDLENAITASNLSSKNLLQSTAITRSLRRSSKLSEAAFATLGGIYL